MKILWLVLLVPMLAAAPTTSSAQDNANPPATSQDRANPEAPQNQPFMATGLDLKGPPRQFRANETPE